MPLLNKRKIHLLKIGNKLTGKAAIAVVWQTNNQLIYHPVKIKSLLLNHQMAGIGCNIF